MAPGRIKKWFKSLGSDSHRARQSDSSDLAPAATKAAAAEPSDLVGDVASPIPNHIEATPQETTSSGPAYRLDPEMAQEYMKNIKRFRILVMGRANAGKTTILQRVCNSTEKPEVFDGKGNKMDGAVVQGTLTRGYHNIEHELVFQSNPGFVFHDSCGFEAGSTQQFDQMRNFVVDHGAATKVNERIHAIWFCIPMTDYHRTVTAAEQKFFNECDTGHVPVIVLLTKVDALYLPAFEGLLDQGVAIAEARERAVEKQGELLERWLAHIKHELGKCNFPPKGYVSLQKMHQESADCSALMQWTANVLNEEGLQRLLISTQQSSIALCVQYAVQKTLRKRMELGFVERLQVAAKDLEYDLLGWFPNGVVAGE
ncbi:hypothetical protein F5J12DRAFT_744309 [Pisolithus orientalis]|uniref:uncharacterized protein n=1 Tax=Pisolithus orientalis TaxID=936130 RepID=UPI0022247485|nr:uncharacterized protein F5J12DRAFT_744309 [Pisolithus orientalis]KAI6002473.1 hypothetical protein F5J12DRAFT_744309 [Pisolithus orientalis]